MLITKTEIVKWNGNTRRHYEEKGYIFTKTSEEFEVKTEHLTIYSKSKVEIQCDGDGCNKILGNIPWSNYLKGVKEDGKYYCQSCANKLKTNIENRNKAKLLKGKTFEQWCLENNRQDVLDRWDYELNELRPNEIGFASMGKNKKGYWFKCLREIHNSELKNVACFTNGQDDSINCKQCNSFAQWGIDNIGTDFLEKYWDYEKNNDIDPWKISYGCGKKAYIICQEKDYHGSYDISCNSFVKGHRCSYCNSNSGKVHQLDSLGQCIIDNYSEEYLESIWSDKNEKSPYEYSPNSTQKVWWKCIDGKHEDYFRNIRDSNKCEFRCPECVRERDESFLQEKVRLYLNKLGYEVFHEHDCTIIPQNPKYKGSKGQMPFDNEVIELKLLCEVQGIQHYEITGFHEMQTRYKNTTPEYELHMQKVRDRYKKFIAYKKGYHYIAIPYWTDNKQEEYKILIDNKIKEVLNIIK